MERSSSELALFISKNRVLARSSCKGWCNRHLYLDANTGRTIIVVAVTSMVRVRVRVSQGSGLIKG